MTDRDRLIDVFTHLDEHISYKEEYGILFDTPFVKAVEDVLQMLKGVTVQEWISVKDRLPEAGEFVLLQYAKNNLNPTQHAKNTMAVGRYEYKLFLVEGCSVNVTHWMPLPQPPKGE